MTVHSWNNPGLVFLLFASLRRSLAAPAGANRSVDRSIACSRRLAASQVRNRRSNQISGCWLSKSIRTSTFGFCWLICIHLLVPRAHHYLDWILHVCWKTWMYTTVQSCQFSWWWCILWTKPLTYKSCILWTKKCKEMSMTQNRVTHKKGMNKWVCMEIREMPSETIGHITHLWHLPSQRIIRHLLP